MNPNEHRTAGEIVFEEYLATQQLSFEFEKQHDGKTKRPDYTIGWQDENLIVDVKDFDSPPNAGGFSAFDPYTNIREKIEQGRDKFKQFKKFSCGLVLYNAGGGIVLLHEEDIMLGSMYGDSGFTFPVNTSTGVGDSSKMERAFLQRGKMLRPNWKYPQNTTISAVITLSQIRPHYLAMLDIMEEHPDMSPTELEGHARQVIPFFDPNRQIPRVIVWHNAVARIPFPEDLFRGPYDSHLGVIKQDDGIFQRVTYRGALLPSRIRI